MAPYNSDMSLVSRLCGSNLALQLMGGAHRPSTHPLGFGFAFALMAGSKFSTAAHGWSSWPPITVI